MPGKNRLECKQAEFFDKESKDKMFRKCLTGQ